MDPGGAEMTVYPPPGLQPQKLTVAMFGVGLIGSWCAQMIARLSGIECMILVDPDVYEKKNLACQNISRADIGEAKVRAVARRLREIRPDLEVREIANAVEEVPAATFNVDLLISCLDSRSSRREVNRLCFGLGVPWIDGGVAGADHLVRVNAYLPGPGVACFECGFEPRHQTLMDTVMPCAGKPENPATATSTEQGALAASLIANEVRKFIEGGSGQMLYGRQLTLETQYHKHFLSTLPVNPQCGFDHHDVPWRIQRHGREILQLTVDEVLSMHVCAESISLPGHYFVRRLRCAGCGRKSGLIWRLSHRIDAGDRVCPQCATAMVAAALDRVCALNGWLDPEWKSVPLSAFGFSVGDVVAVQAPAGKIYLQLGG